MRPSEPSSNQIQPRTLLRLSVAAAILLPDGSLSASELLHECARLFGDRTSGECLAQLAWPSSGYPSLSELNCDVDLNMNRSLSKVRATSELRRNPTCGWRASI
jgi:hypothetical protein